MFGRLRTSMCTGFRAVGATLKKPRVFVPLSCGCVGIYYNPDGRRAVASRFKKWKNSMQNSVQPALNEHTLKLWATEYESKHGPDALVKEMWCVYSRNCPRDSYVYCIEYADLDGVNDVIARESAKLSYYQGLQVPSYLSDSTRAKVLQILEQKVAAINKDIAQARTRLAKLQDQERDKLLVSSICENITNSIKSR